MGMNKDQQAFVQDKKPGRVLVMVTKINPKSRHKIERERHLHTMMKMIQFNKVMTIHLSITTIQS